MEKMKHLRIWKRMTAIVLVIAMAAALCGCVRYRAIGTVHEDGTITFYVLYATLSGYMLDGSGDAELSDEKRAELEKAGWSIQPYKGEPSDEEEYTGYVISKSDIPLEKLHDEVGSLEFGSQSLENLTCTKKGDIYSIDWDVAEIQAGLDDLGLNTGDMFSMGGFTEFVIKLPNEPVKDNATSRQGLELKWDINSIKEPIHVEFELEEVEETTTVAKTKKSKKSDDSKGGVPMWLAIVLISVVAAGAIAAVVIVIVVNKRKKASSPDATLNAQVMQNGMPAQTYAPPQMPSPYAQQPMQSPYAQQPMQSPYAQQPMQSPYAQQPMQSPYAPPTSTPTSVQPSTFGLPQVGQAPNAGFDNNQNSQNQ